MWWIFGILVIGFIIYLINKDYKEEVQTKITNKGGMHEKYRTVIDYFANNLQGRISKQTKDSLVVTASSTVIHFDYVHGYLEINIMGVVPIIGKYSNKWKYKDGYPQEKMIEEIENYMEWVLQKINNLADKNSSSINKDEIAFSKIVKEEFSSMLNSFDYSLLKVPSYKFISFKNVVEGIQHRTYYLGLDIDKDTAQAIIDGELERVEQIINKKSKNIILKMISIEEFMQQRNIKPSQLSIGIKNRAHVLMVDKKAVASISKKLCGNTIKETYSNLGGINIEIEIYLDATKLPCAVESTKQWEEIELF